MQPVIVHYCNVCTYNTTLRFSASVFSETQTCSHCGAVSEGVNTRPTTVEQADMQQEELASLFLQKLNFSNNVANAPPVADIRIEEPVESQSMQPQPIFYASQHYHHSTHVAKTPTQDASNPFDVNDIQAALLRNSIEPSSLSPSQINLFQNADNDQRLRLLELWRISPPRYEAHQAQMLAQEFGTWPETSLQQEEMLAKLRYEQMEQAKQRQQQSRLLTAADWNSYGDENQMEQVMEDLVMPSSPAVRMVPQILSTSTSAPELRRDAEPYITSGYESLSKRDYNQQANALQDSTRYNHATDPAYKDGMGLWAKHATDTQDMENQYGAYQAMRSYTQFDPMDGDMVM